MLTVNLVRVLARRAQENPNPAVRRGIARDAARQKQYLGPAIETDLEWRETVNQLELVGRRKVTR